MSLNSDMGHWLIFNAAREVIGCHCGFEADVATDCGYGDSVIDHMLGLGIAERDSARDLAVALEQRLARVEALADDLDGAIGMGESYDADEAIQWCAKNLRAALEADDA